MTDRDAAPAAAEQASALAEWEQWHAGTAGVGRSRHALSRDSFLAGWNMALAARPTPAADARDTRERCHTHTFIALEDCDVHGPKSGRR